MAKQLSEMGVDYLTIKPYSQHLHSENTFQIDYNAMLELEQEIKQYATPEFAIYFRANAMNKINELDINKICREACRLDEINKYLDELKHS